MMNGNKARIVLALLAFSAVAAVQGDTLECPLICPDLYAPTCATDGTVNVQFDNPCALEVFNCKRQRSSLPIYTGIDIDWCTTVEIDELDADMDTDLEETNPSCLRPCPMIYSPVCGSNGSFRKVFSNECEMNMFNCLYKTKTNRTWRILKQGICSQNSEDEWW